MMEVITTDEPMDESPLKKRPKSAEDSELDLMDLDISYSYSLERNPISRGAEATISKCIYLGKRAILKQRISKAYRHPVLDRQLIKQRMNSEIKGIYKCKMVTFFRYIILRRFNNDVF